MSVRNIDYIKQRYRIELREAERNSSLAIGRDKANLMNVMRRMRRSQ